MKINKQIILSLSFIFFSLAWVVCAFTQGGELEFSLDVNSPTVVLPRIFRPNIDLSGRGFNRDAVWPQNLASLEAIELWEKEIGFNGLYRIQYNLWEISEHAKQEKALGELFANYEKIIKKVSDSGGIVILDIFGTPAGLGKVLDKKSPPVDVAAFKELVKSFIREFSCNKKYNIWYEVWTAPDLDDFFLGRKQEYLTLYRAAAEAVKDLELESGIHIPIGGPGSSWWFQNDIGNSIVTPERSLIYDLIRYAYHYRLPLDFISWHAYSTDPKAENEMTRYKKAPIELIRDWLSYFNYSKDTPLIIDEWNYDSGANILPARGDRASIGASFIPARLINMYKAGLDYQLYFCLEDFQNNKEGVVRNVGAFWFDSGASGYKGAPKAIYNVFKMFNLLGSHMFKIGIDDEFIGALAGKDKDTVTVLFYNYVDPYMSRNYLAHSIATLAESERKNVLNIIKSGKLDKIISGEVDVSRMHATKKLKSILRKAQGLNNQAQAFKNSSRRIKVKIKNLKGDYTLDKYIIDSSCSSNCKFEPVGTKEVAGGSFEEALEMQPYSVQLLVFKKMLPKELLKEEVLPVEKETPKVKHEDANKVSKSTGDKKSE